MTPLETLGFALGTSFASGLNLYLTILATGLFQRFGVINLPPALHVLSDPVVLGLAAVLFIVEFVADKIPVVDSAWDAVHTFIRPPAAAVLAYSALGDVPQVWQVGAGLLAGGVALSSHGVKASTRAAANTSPEPFSNWILSLTGDAIAIFFSWMAATYPLLTGVVALVLAIVAVFVIWKLFGFLRRVIERIRGRVAAAQAEGG